jgi:hypothetical protein
MRIYKLIIFFALLIPQIVFGFKAKSYSVGLGYYSQNFLAAPAQDETGKSGMFGATVYPLNFKYDFEIKSNWFWAPQLSHVFVPRKSDGDSTSITLTHLAFLFGKNVSGQPKWDWYFGPGILQQEIKGAGGSVTLLNGNTPTDFDLPGRSATTRKLSIHTGTSYIISNFRLSADLIFENFFSSTKRAQNLMFSFAYAFGAGGGGQGSPSGAGNHPK